MINGEMKRFPQSNHYASFPACSIGNIPILKDTLNELYYHIGHSKIIQYWKQRNRTTESNTSRTIDTTSLANGMKKHPMNVKKFI